MARHRMLFALAWSVMLMVAAFAPVSLAAPAEPGITPDKIGVVDPVKIMQQIPDYVDLANLQKSYDQELGAYTQLLQTQLQSYMVELNRLKAAESKGKTPSQIKVIEAKYAEMAQQKQDELNQLLAVRKSQLQAKLNEQTERVKQRVRDIVGTVCQEKGLIMALNRTTVFLGGVDITDDVIAKANGAAE